MRDILFRGKRENDDVWVYGIPYENYIIREICWDNEFPEALLYPVHFGTIGQFTGLTDKNGTKIFEGDIVKNHKEDTGVIQWFEEHIAFMIFCTNQNKVYFLYDNDFSEIEVVGNIHDSIG